jgi:hypothetical protein
MFGTQTYNVDSLNLLNKNPKSNYPYLKEFLVKICQNKNITWDDLIEKLNIKIEPVIDRYKFIWYEIKTAILNLKSKLQNYMSYNEITTNVENTALHFAILCLQFTESADDVKTYDFCSEFLRKISNLLSVPTGIVNLYNRFNRTGFLDYFEFYLPLCSRQKIEIALLFSSIDTSFNKVIEFFDIFPPENYLTVSPNQLFNSEMIQAIQHINERNFIFHARLEEMSLYEFNVMITSKLYLQIFFTNFLIMNTPRIRTLPKILVKPEDKIFYFFNLHANYNLFESYVLPHQELLDDSNVSTDDMLIIGDDDSKVINKLFLYFIKLYENTFMIVSTFERILFTLSKEDKIITLTPPHTRDQLRLAITGTFNNQKTALSNFLKEKKKNFITLNDMEILNFLYNCLKEILDNEILKNVFTDETYQTFQESFNKEEGRGASSGLLQKINQLFQAAWLVEPDPAVGYFKKILSPSVLNYKRGQESAAKEAMDAMNDLRDDFDPTLLPGER